MSIQEVESIVEIDGDGTVFNTHDNILGSTVSAVGEVLGKIVTEEELLPYFGMAIRPFYRVLGAIEDQIDACIAAHVEYQNANFGTVTAFEGAYESLARIKQAGIPIALVTSRGGNSLDILLKRTGIGDLIDTAVTSNCVKVHKPDPHPFAIGLKRVRDQRGIAIPPTIYVVGDTEPDILGGKNLQKALPHKKVRTIGAEYGQKGSHVLTYSPDYGIKSIRELPEIVLGR